jgi:hypothetical protein
MAANVAVFDFTQCQILARQCHRVEPVMRSRGKLGFAKSAEQAKFDGSRQIAASPP